MSKVKVLYDFVAEPNSAELSITAGEILTVTNTNVGEGWWEGSNLQGQRGLFPAAYVEAISVNQTNFSADHPVQSADRYDKPDPWDEPDSDFSDDGTESHYTEIPGNDATGTSHTFFPTSQLPQPPDNGNTISAPLRRPPKMFSKSSDSYILGTLSVNVPPEERVHIIQNAIGYVWKPNNNNYYVTIASPKTESKLKGLKTFTAYQLTPSHTNIVVSRRYKQFDWLHERLVDKFSLIPIPPLPAKQQTGRFEEQFIEHRRAQLQEFTNYMCDHPILSNCEVWKHFITCTDEKRWKAGKRKAERDTLVGATFSATINAPEKHLLQSDVDKELEYLNSLTHQMTIAVKAIMSIADDQTKKFQIQSKKDFQRIGESFSELAKALDIDERRLTTDSALSQAVGRTAAIYINIGQLFGEQPKRDWLPLSDRFHIYRGILLTYPDILAEHRNAMQKRKECERLTSDQKMGNSQLQEVNRRTDVMSYAVMAEVNQFRLHRDKNLKQTMNEFITAQIEFYKNIVEKLEEARSYFQ
uniref:CSON000917 protein n=1 Tax=Culicoides sonorensis TaxID=179676 RepID=A0A336LU90_CULSO